MVDALEIGYAVKRRRAQLGMTQEQVARASGVSKRCVWSIELGENSGVQLDKLTSVLGVLGLDLVLAEGDAPASRQPQVDNSAAVVEDGAERRGSIPDYSASPSAIDALAILTGGKS